MLKRIRDEFALRPSACVLGNRQVIYEVGNSLESTSFFKHSREKLFDFVFDAVHYRTVFVDIPERYNYKSLIINLL